MAEGRASARAKTGIGDASDEYFRDKEKCIDDYKMPRRYQNFDEEDVANSGIKKIRVAFRGNDSNRTVP